MTAITTPKTTPTIIPIARKSRGDLIKYKSLYNDIYFLLVVSSEGCVVMTKNKEEKYKKHYRN